MKGQCNVSAPPDRTLCRVAWDAGNVKGQRAAIPIRGGVAVIVLHGSSSEISNEGCLLLLLMGKKSAECFKEKCFMAARVFFGRIGKIWPTLSVRGISLGTQGQCRCLKALHDSVDANVYRMDGENFSDRCSLTPHT